MSLKLISRDSPTLMILLNLICFSILQLLRPSLRLNYRYLMALVIHQLVIMMLALSFFGPSNLLLHVNRSEEMVKLLLESNHLQAIQMALHLSISKIQTIQIGLQLHRFLETGITTLFRFTLLTEHYYKEITMVTSQLSEVSILILQLLLFKMAEMHRWKKLST